MVRCRKKHKGKEKVVRARGKRPHRAGTFLLGSPTGPPPLTEVFQPALFTPSQWVGNQPILAGAEICPY